MLGCRRLQFPHPFRRLGVVAPRKTMNHRDDEQAPARRSRASKGRSRSSPLSTPPARRYATLTTAVHRRGGAERRRRRTLLPVLAGGEEEGADDLRPGDHHEGERTGRRRGSHGDPFTPSGGFAGPFLDLDFNSSMVSNSSRVELRSRDRDYRGGAGEGIQVGVADRCRRSAFWCRRSGAGGVHVRRAYTTASRAIPDIASPPPQPKLPPDDRGQLCRGDREQRIRAGLPEGRSAGADRRSRRSPNGIAARSTRGATKPPPAGPGAAGAALRRPPATAGVQAAAASRIRARRLLVLVVAGLADLFVRAKT